jgi:hypothetical protein
MDKHTMLPSLKKAFLMQAALDVELYNEWLELEPVDVANNFIRK